MTSKIVAVLCIKILALLVLHQGAIAKEYELLDPFDSNRIYGKENKDDPPVDDSGKVCKDRWFNEYRGDINREKEYLENFDLKNMKFTGTIFKDGELWALVKALPKGGVSRVGVGNFLGKNYGEVREVNLEYIVLTEVVRATGLDEGDHHQFIKKCSYLLRSDLTPSDYELPEFP